MERKHIGRFEIREFRIWNGRGIFSKFGKGIQRRRWKDSKSSRFEEARIRRKNNGRVCLEILKNSKRKQIWREATNKKFKRDMNGII